jgi:uncharacterized hydrophobic protein (TIGR00271 family)
MMESEQEDFLGEIRLGHGLAHLGQVVARGAIVVLGLVELATPHALRLTGQVAAGAALLAAGLLALTILNIIELLAGSSERGGTYTLVHETLGGMGGFVAGWVIFAGNMALTAAFMQGVGEHVAGLIPGWAGVSVWLGIGLLVFMVVLQLFRLLPKRDLLWPITVLLFLGLVLGWLHARLGGFLPRAGASTSREFLHVSAWIATAYAAVESVMAVRRQIRNPEKHLPRALLATAFGAGLLFAGVSLLFGKAFAGDEMVHASLGAWLNAMEAQPDWIGHVLSGIVLYLAANRCMMTAARQLYSLSRQQALPQILRRLWPPFRLQPLLFVVTLAAAIPLMIWVSNTRLLDLAAGWLLVGAFTLNLAALYSRRAEPERRRKFEVPFYPLVPLTAMVLCAALWLALPGLGLLEILGWLFAGLVVYAIYSRTHLLVAQEGVLVFGRDLEHEKEEGTPRILVPLSSGVERHLLLELAMGLARQMGGELIPLQVIPISDPLAIAEGRRLAKERNTLFQWSTRLSAKSGIPTFPITRLAHTVSEGILETADEERCDLILLSWAIGATQRNARMGSVLDPVILGASCDIAVVAFQPEQLKRIEPESEEQEAGEEAVLEAGRVIHIDRVLVPTAGGPHAPLATRLALLLAMEFSASVDVVYVVGPNPDDEELSIGEQRIQNTLDAMREQVEELLEVRIGMKDWNQVPISSKVVTANSVVEGIAKAGSESDLVFLGASEESIIDQVLFGALPEQVAHACLSPVVMVKRFRGIRRFWLSRLWDALFGSLPTVSGREQIDVYKEVRRGARPDIDFFVMIGLSAIIATYGLLQDSGAVIIGAMLVAPLFTPILAFSMAVVRGDIRLLRLALESTLKGVALAVGLAALLTALSPLRMITHEISARTQPNLFDLAVALASGAAGAYAVARKDVAASLPGVAIAAALVPPLGVVGVGMAMGDPTTGWGGLLLFSTNLIAITLSGSVVLLLLGFRPTPRAERAARLRMGLAASVILLVLISVPLAAVFVNSVQESQTRRLINQIVLKAVEDDPDLEVGEVAFREADDALDVTVTFYAQEELSQAFMSELMAELSNALDQPMHLQLRRIPIQAIDLVEP